MIVDEVMALNTLFASLFVAVNSTRSDHLRQYTSVGECEVEVVVEMETRRISFILFIIVTIGNCPFFAFIVSSDDIIDCTFSTNQFIIGIKVMSDTIV